MNKFLIRNVILLCVVMVGWSPPAWARLGKRSDFSIYTMYSFFVPLLTGTNTDNPDLQSTLDTYLDLRFYRTYSFILTYSHGFNENGRQGFGFGARVDLPGFMWFGGSRRDFNRSKKKAINTSVFIITQNVTAEGDSSSATTVISKYGMTFDFFFLETAYITFDLGLYNYQGDTSFTYSTGFGLDY